MDFTFFRINIQGFIIRHLVKILDPRQRVECEISHYAHFGITNACISLRIADLATGYEQGSLYLKHFFNLHFKKSA